MPNLKKVGLVLGSGGARGLCFIGALKALEENGITISAISGSSMGAIIGAAWASGADINGLRKLADEIKPLKILRPDFLGLGILSNEPLQKLIKRHIPTTRLEDLQIPMWVSCSDLLTGSGVIYNKGDLAKIVAGSSLAAGIFSPVSYDNKLLVDGGYTDMVPLEPITDEVDVIISIDATVQPQWELGIKKTRSIGNLINPSNVWKMFIKSIDTTNQHFNNSMLSMYEHIHICPELSGITFSDYGKGEKAINAGEKAIIGSLPKIRSQIQLS